MKKIIFTIAILIGFAGIAQETDSKRKTMADMTAEQIATLRTKKMTLALDLTDDQFNKVYEVNLENAKLRKAKMTAHKAVKESGKKEKPTAELKYARQNEKLDYMIAQKSKMKSILSAEQYAKWEKMSYRRGMHHKRGKMNKKREMHHSKGEQGRG